MFMFTVVPCVERRGVGSVEVWEVWRCGKGGGVEGGGVGGGGVGKVEL